MNKNIRLALASVALSVVVAGAPVLSFSAAAEEAQIIELKNGGQVKVEGENVSVINKDGSATPANGKFETKDGKVIEAKDGKIAG